jgi:radical SAM protein with 4Fe4S-binding SPASM domain
MDISPFEQWKLRYIIHLAIYLNLNSPTDFFDEAEKIIHDYTQATYQDCQSCWIHRMCGVSCFKDCVQDGCINAELKQKLCQKARKTRHEEIISMLELLEKNPRALEHFDKYLTV